MWSRAALVALALMLGGCGYREKKAPCGPGEGALFYADPCGQLRPVNPPPFERLIKR